MRVSNILCREAANYFGKISSCNQCHNFRTINERFYSFFIKKYNQSTNKYCINWQIGILFTDFFLTHPLNAAICYYRSQIRRSMMKRIKKYSFFALALFHWALLYAPPSSIQFQLEQLQRPSPDTFRNIARL